MIAALALHGADRTFTGGSAAAITASVALP